MSSPASGRVSPVRETVQISQLHDFLGKLPKNEVTQKVDSLIKEYEQFNNLIDERSKAAPGYYADPDNPTYKQDVDNKYDYFNKIADICKNKLNLTIIQ